MNPVSIEYEVTTGDVAGWLRYQILTSRLYRIALAVSWLIGGSMMLTSMVGRFGSNWLGDILHGLFVGGTMSGVIFIQFLTTRFQAKRFLRGCPSGGGERNRIEFDQSGYRVESDLGKGELKWAAIVEVIETPSSFFLKIAAHMAIVAPKRAFNPGQLHEFRALVQTAGKGPKAAGLAGRWS